MPESALTKYIREFQLREYPIPDDKDCRDILDHSVRREFMSNVLGGNMQSLFSYPNKKKVAEHGHKMFVYPTLSLHCLAPQRPGYPGLILNCPPRVYDEPWTGDGVFPVITGLAPGAWMYVGHFEWKGAGWLTKEEWKELPDHVRGFSGHKFRQLMFLKFVRFKRTGYLTSW